MTSLTQNRITTAVALLLPGAATLWLLMRSSMAGTGTFAVFAALVIAIALIAFNTWKNSQPTGSWAAHTRRRRDIVAHCPRCGGPDERGAVGRRAEPLGSICLPGSRARMAGAQRCRHGRTA